MYVSHSRRKSIVVIESIVPQEVIPIDKRISGKGRVPECVVLHVLDDVVVEEPPEISKLKPMQAA